MGKGKAKDLKTADKSIGLNEELIAEISEYPELASLLRLHDLNKKVSGKNDENRDKINKLRIAFQSLGEKVKEFSKD